MKYQSIFGCGKLIATLSVIAFFSCSENDIQLNNHDNMLILNDQEQFDELVDFVMEADSAELAEYTQSLDFKSLRTVMDEVEAAEEKLLAELEAKYDPEIARPREYAPITKAYLEKGVLRLDEFGIPELNITVPAFAIFLNEDREMKIDNQIVRFGYENVSIIGPGSESQIAVNPVERITNEGKEPSLENAKSCTSTSDNYRLITYENNLIYSQPGSPCYDSRFSHWVRLRSLKKVFGSWFNHKTTALHIRGVVKLAHYEYNHSTNERKFIRYMVNEYHYFYDLPEDHTAEHYFVLNYPLRYGANNECISYQIGFDYTNHIGYGKNGTACRI